MEQNYKTEQQRLAVSKWTINFGKYKGKTYDVIDKKYAIWMLSSDIFDNPIYKVSNTKIIDFLCNKFNVSIE